MAGFPDDLLNLSAELLDLAKTRGVTIATAESCTGGLIAALLTEVPGSSAVVERGFVTYSNEAKTEMLGVPAETIAEHGAVSEPVAKSMAAGAAANSRATVAVSVTGIAGPGGSEFKPEGRVCFGLSDGTTVTVEFGPLGRSAVRIAAVRHSLGLLRSFLHKYQS